MFKPVRWRLDRGASKTSIGLISKAREWSKACGSARNIVEKSGVIWGRSQRVGATSRRDWPVSGLKRISREVCCDLI